MTFRAHHPPELLRVFLPGVGPGRLPSEGRQQFRCQERACSWNRTNSARGRAFTARFPSTGLQAWGGWRDSNPRCLTTQIHSLIPNAFRITHSTQRRFRPFDPCL